MGCCSVLQCVAVWFEVDLRTHQASLFRVICVLSVFIISFALPSLSSCPFWTIVHTLPRAIGVGLLSRGPSCRAPHGHAQSRAIFQVI